MKLPSEAQNDIYHCLKCGLCLAVCPIYREIRLESVAPRNKVQLAKALLEGKLKLSRNLQKVLSLCLTCQACEANCPSGLRIEPLIIAMRTVLASHYGLEWKKWFFYKKVIMGKRTLLLSRWSLKLIKQTILKYLPFNPKIGAIYLQNLPLTEKYSLHQYLPEIIPARTSDIKGRIIYFPGCLTDYILPSVGIALVRVLTHSGYDVILPKRLKCCSYPVIIAGQEPGVLINIKSNLQVLSSLEAIGIVTSCPTCGLALKRGYLSLLANHNEDLILAQRISSKTWDITEFIHQNINLPQLFLLEEAFNHSQDIVYHDPCHLAFGQAIRREPREILQQLPGRKLKEIGGPISCCGSGGAFHLFSPDISTKIGKNRMQEIQKTEAKDIATGCPACILQLSNNLAGNSGGYQILHTIQWVDKVIPRGYKINNRYQ